MDIKMDLERSIETLYESLVGKDSVNEKALHISFFAQFRSTKKVDHEPLDLCKFLFWRRWNGFDTEVFFSDDVLMDILRKGKRLPGEKSIFSHVPTVRHIGECCARRLGTLAATLSKHKSVPFFLEEITFQKVSVLDLTSTQFQGELSRADGTFWQWEKETKKFISFGVGKNKLPV